MARPLFRPEVLAKQINRHYGTVSIAVPIQYRWLALAIGLCLFFIFMIVIFGQFTEKFIVNGYLETRQGVANIFPHTPGAVTKCFKQEGDHVKKGEPLLMVDTLLGDTETAILEKLESRKRAIGNAIKHKKNDLMFLKKLLVKHYISNTLYQAKEESIEIAQQQRNAVEVEILNYKNKQSYVIFAPVNGVISSLLSQVGQHCALDKPLMKILPDDNTLVAALFVPVQQAGFLHHNAKIFIRYDAYPYVHYGHVEATIQSISSTVLTDADEEKPILIGKPYYKVIALLEQSRTYMKRRHLRQGMTLSAVMMGPKRRIWQWFFDPLFTFCKDVI